MGKKKITAADFKDMPLSDMAGLVEFSATVGLAHRILAAAKKIELAGITRDGQRLGQVAIATTMTDTICAMLETMAGDEAAWDRLRGKLTSTQRAKEGNEDATESEATASREPGMGTEERA